MNLKEAAQKVASYFNSSLEEELKPKYWWSRKTSFYDTSHRLYSASFSRRHRGYLVDAASVRLGPKIRKKIGLGRKKRIYKFIVKEGGLFLSTSPEVIYSYIKRFLERRNYFIEKLEVKKEPILEVLGIGILGAAQEADIISQGHEAVVLINRGKNNWEVRLKDKNPRRPYFCSQNHQYVFHFSLFLKIEKEPLFSEFLLDYQESEPSTTSPNPFSLIKRAIYGFKSHNLRNFYSEGGLFPEIRHAIRFQVLFYFASSIVAASVLVRVAEKLKGNTWYVLVAGILAFVRIPAEMKYLRRSLEISKHLPGSILQEISESEEFKSIYESREIRVWRNFEKAFFKVFRGEEYLSEKIETYHLIKPEIYQKVLAGNKEEIEKLLQEKFNLSLPQVSFLRPFIKELLPMNKKKVAEETFKKIEKLEEKGILTKDRIGELKDYATHSFPENLERYSCFRAHDLLNDILKKAERAPNKKEIHNLVKNCRSQMLPFRYFDLFLFLSLFGVGYAASFSPLPLIFYPIYYLFNGALANIINPAITRISSQVDLQYIYRDLENDPGVRSAADTWNEYGSHRMRLWALFSSLGLIIGLGGKFLSSFTFGISRFFVEGLALFCYLKGLNEWFLYHDGLKKKSRLPESMDGMNR